MSFEHPKATPHESEPTDSAAESTESAIDYRIDKTPDSIDPAVNLEESRQYDVPAIPTEETPEVKIEPTQFSTNEATLPRSSETTTAPEIVIDPSERLIQTEASFSPTLRERLQNAPEAVKQAATKAYEGLSSVPLVGRTLGKMEMAYSQHWAERHEQKALRIKEQFDRHDAKIKTLEESQREIETQMKELAASGIPGADSLQLFLQKIDKEKTATLQQRDAAETKIKFEQDKIANYTEKRDRVANRFIEALDQKLAPHQERMRHLDICKAECDLEISVARARHDQELSELQALSDKKDVIVSQLLKTGMSVREIERNSAILNINKHISDGRFRVQFEMEKLDQKLSKVKYQVSQIKKKSSPYEQKRAVLERLKNSRRVQINLPTTETLVEQVQPVEVTEVPPAEPSTANDNTEVITPAPNPENSASIDPRMESLVRRLNESSETPEAANDNIEKVPETANDFLAAWDKHVHKSFPKEYTNLQIKPDEFFKRTSLSPKKKLSPKVFYNLVEKYCITKGGDEKLWERALKKFK